MKLEGVLEDTVYATHRGNIYASPSGLDFDKVGQLPKIGLQTRSPLRLVQTNYITKSLLAQLVGPYLTTNLWPVSKELFYATHGDHLFRSLDGGGTWMHIRQLPSSSGPMGVLPSGFCAHDGTISLGEYPLDRAQPPHLLTSSNQGNSWRVIETINARHIHAVQIDPFTGDRWITTGDTDKESMIARISNGNLEIVGTGSQLWRAVDLVFTPSSIIWGMDCPYASENRIVKVDRDEHGSDELQVETLHTVSSPVYFATSVETDGEFHIFFSTAIEPATEPKHRACVLHASSADEFETWQTIVSYEKGSYPLSKFINVNSYIFLAVHPERGLFINPYNTRRDHGTILNTPIDKLW